MRALLPRLALLFALLAAAPTLAEQSSFCIPTTGTLSGLALVNALNNAFEDFATSHSGADAPANDCTEAPLEGQWWLDTDVSPAVLKIFDGTAWEIVATLNEATGTWKPPVGGGAVSLSSGATTDLWSIPDSTISVTGNSTISALAGGTAVAGTWKWVRFTGTPTLTYNATSLILPTGASISVGAGDSALVIALGGGNVMVAPYTRANGQALTAPSALTANLVISGVISPSSLSANQNDWAPSGLASATVVRVTASTAVSVTGIAAQTSGSWVVLQNISTSNSITLADASASSSAANRFSLGADYLLGPQQGVLLRYDGTLSRWVVIAGYRQIASQAEATAGTDNAKVMTPLRNAQAFQTIAPPFARGLLYGLTLSNNAGDATNDIDIAAGVAADATNVRFMTGAALTKQTDVAWAVGSSQGCLDTGSIGNGTYHFFLIARSDTGVVDVLCSLSATAPTMPANYDFKRRIGAIIRSAGTVLGFTQYGDDFHLKDIVVANITGPGNAAVTYTLVPMPTGIVVQALLTVGMTDDTTGFSSQQMLFTELAQNNPGGSPDNNTLWIGGTGDNDDINVSSNDIELYTNSSAQIRYDGGSMSGDTDLKIRVKGWRDSRGRLN